MPMTISGMDATLAGFRKAGIDVEKKCIRAVKAGAQYVANSLAENAPVYDGDPKKGITPGALRDSIRPGSVKWNPGDGYNAKIAPVGNMPGTGEPLAKIGNVLEHGRSDMPPRPWWEPTLVKVARDAQDVMQDAFHAD